MEPFPALFTLIILIRFNFAHSTELRLKFFKRRHEMENKFSTEGLLKEMQVERRLDCLSQCDRSNNCRVSLYNPHFNTCRLYEKQHDKTHDQSGWQNWAKKTNFGEQCRNPRDCNYGFGRCLQNICTCIIGYSYNFGDGECVTSCSAYGHSFTRYPASSIYGCNTKTIYTLTEKQCMEKCRDEQSFDCISCEIQSSGRRRKCNMCNTVWNNLGKTKAGTDRDWNLYYRHCKTYL